MIIFKTCVIYTYLTKNVRKVKAIELITVV